MTQEATVQVLADALIEGKYELADIAFAIAFIVAVVAAVWAVTRRAFESLLLFTVVGLIALGLLVL